MNDTETPPTPETADPDVIDGIDEGQPIAVPAPILPRLYRVPGGVPNLDLRLEERAAQSPDEAIRFRIQPELYFETRTGWGRNAQRTYVRMTGVVWGIEATPDQIRDFRVALDGFVNEWVRRKQGETSGL